MYHGVKIFAQSSTFPDLPFIKQYLNIWRKPIVSWRQLNVSSKWSTNWHRWYRTGKQCYVFISTLTTYGCLCNFPSSEFKHQCHKKLEALRNTAMNARQYDEAVSLYSAALSFKHAPRVSPFISWSEARSARAMWKDALDDANEVWYFVIHQCVILTELLRPSHSICYCSSGIRGSM